MKEYIEREAVLSEINHKNEVMKTSFLKQPLCVGDVIHCIHSAPAADVASVRHGHWIDTDTFDAHYSPIFECSECNKQVADNYISCHKYCLHCGACMDGGKDSD